MKTVGVVVPAYGEEEVIELFHLQLVATLSALQDRYKFSIVYVIDKSPDLTEEKLRQIATTQSDVTVLVLSRRFGHQAALIAGIDYCKTNAIVMLDGDLQHPPHLIPLMLERFEAGADVVQMIRRETARSGLVTRITSYVFYRILDQLAPMHIPPEAADFRLISSRVAEVFRSKLHEKNMFFRGLILWVGFNISFIPFASPARAAGVTKYGFLRRLEFALTGLCSFSKMPLRICILLGLCVALVSLLAGAEQIVSYKLGVHSVPGWASLMLALSVSIGIQLFFIGVVGEYVGLIFDEVKDRPRYLIERKFSQERRPTADTEGSSS